MSSSNVKLALLVLATSLLAPAMALRPSLGVQTPVFGPDGITTRSASVAQPLSAADIAIRHHEEEECTRFLRQNLPARDRGAIDAGFLNRHIELALRARRTQTWLSEVPFSIFLNNVLPYAR